MQLEIEASLLEARPEGQSLLRVARAEELDGVQDFMPAFGR